MSRQRRLENKRRRREKRLQRQRGPERELSASDPVARLARVLEAAHVPPPENWPGASDPKLDRPDQVKFEIAQLASQIKPGKSKLKQLEDGFRRGLLGQIPEIEHWAMEEFFWHGAPGDSWHPIEAFLENQTELLSPAAQEQIRRWKDARFGLFEVGEVRDDTVTFQEWDPISRAPVGSTFRAITLNIGGINAYRDLGGRVTATYVAPWAPDESLYRAGTAVDGRVPA